MLGGRGMRSDDPPGDGLRVLFIAPTLGPGGAERHWAGLLPVLARRGFTPRVVALQGGGQFSDELKAAGVPVSVFARGYRDPRAICLGLGRELRRNPDLIVTIGTNADLAGAVGAKLIGAHHILNWHKQTGKRLGPRRRVLTRACAWLGSSVIAVSGSQTPDLRGLGFPAENISIINNGTIAPQPRRSPTSTRDSLGISDQHPFVLGVGRLSVEKGFTTFIEAIVNIRSRGIPVVGVIAGDGPDRHRLQQQIDQCGADVMLLGPRRDTADLYAAADVLCLTSEFEAMPMVILEAFAARLPVVAPAIGGIGEAVVDGVNGVLVRDQSAAAYADAVLSVAQHPSRGELGDAALETYLTHFTHEVMVDHYASKLEEIVGEATRTTSL
jgi:glycosyltransferase involved in cell wall biosynthesis